jgi:SAM-dependent methyltransferase
MELRYAVFNAAGKVKAPFSRKQRQERMQLFIKKMEIKGGERIIDLGGSAAFWSDCPLSLNLTIVNLPGSLVKENPNKQHNVTFVEGNACDLPLISDESFDIAFSNSVIEHVGPRENQVAFAREVNRIAPRFWVQTPSLWFPIEAHNHMPFWWAYPEPLKRKFISRWRQKLPAWTEMIEGTTVIKRKELERMFPTGTIWTERFAGFPKSYVIYS